MNRESRQKKEASIATDPLGYLNSKFLQFNHQHKCQDMLTIHTNQPTTSGSKLKTPLTRTQKNLNFNESYKSSRNLMNSYKSSKFKLQLEDRINA